MAVDKQIIETQVKGLGSMSRWASKKEIAYLPELILPGEQIQALTKGLYIGFEYLITVTDRRVLLLRKGIIGAKKQIEIHPGQINSVSHRVGLLAGTIDILLPGVKTAIELVDKADVAEVARCISALTLAHDSRKGEGGND